MTGSGTTLGIVAAFQYLPMLLFGPYSGVLIDRFPRRKIIYLTQAISGLLALILGILVLTGLIKVWMIYILALFLGLINTIDIPAGQNFSLEMVGEEKLQNAVSLDATLKSLARAVGPAIAGALLLTLGVGLCFIVNAISYIAVLIALFMMREKEMHPMVLVPAEKGQMMQGFKYIKSNYLIRDTLILITIVGAFSCEFQTAIPLLAKFTFNGDVKIYTLLTVVFGIGSMFGGFFTASKKRTAPHILINACLLLGLAMFLVALSPNIITASIFLAISGAVAIFLVSLANVTLQLESAPEMRGRVLAIYAVGYFGSPAIGAPAIGWICEFFGARWGFAAGGFAAVLAAILAIPTLKKDKYLKISKKLSRV